MTTEQNNSSALSKQDLSTLDVAKLTALSPEVISRQATINIGTIGHVAHGKSTVVKAVSGVQTVRFKNELERNITIKLDCRDCEDSILDADTTVAEQGEGMRKRKTQPVTTTKLKKRRLHQSAVPLVYEVEHVLDYKVEGDKHYYEIKWKNWNSSSNTWEPLENLDGCHDALFDFLEKMIEKNQFMEANYLNLASKLSKCDDTELSNLLADYVTPKGIHIPVPDNDQISKRLKIVSMWPESERDSKVLEIVRHDILKDKLYQTRQLQLDALKEWEDEMNTIINNKNSLLTVVNAVDLESPPENFTYINDYLPGEQVSIPEDPPFGCSCKPKCTGLKKKCCPLSSGSSLAYDKYGHIKVPPGTPVYECNKSCSCGPDCVNRVVQKGRTVKLSIFRTSSGCGWGVKTLESIAKGSFVSEYVGEVITNEEANRRGKKYDEEGLTYLFDLDFNDTEKCQYTVDAAEYGNISHFVNHSCEPNMTTYAVWIDCLEPNLPKLALFANRDIKQGEEISFDYLNQSKMKNVLTTDKKKNGISPVTVKRKSNMICKCGSKKCRKFYL